MTAPAQTPNPMAITFEDPGAIGVARPRVADMHGRMVFVQPTVLDRVPKPESKTGEMQDRITATVTICDGGPLQFGGNPAKHIPHTMTVSTPYTAEGIFISQQNMVQALRKALPSVARPTGGVVLGVIELGTQSDPLKNRPWNITPLGPADPRRQLAQQILQGVITGTFTNPEPAELVASAPAVPASPAPTIDPNAAFLAWQAQQQAQAAPAAPAVPAPPAGWTPEVWNALSDAQRQAILDSTTATGTPPL